MIFIHLFVIISQEGWCDGIGSVEQIQAKLLKRQEAAAKRERAMAYALTHQVTRNLYVLVNFVLIISFLNSLVSFL